MTPAGLETRIPPPVAAVAIALTMLAARLVPHRLPLERPGRIGLAVLLALAGLAFAIPAVLAFRRARTTVNPVRIGQVSTLVTDGIFAVSRNPMYVGLVFVLTAWAVLLGSPWALLGPPALAAFLTRFQIVPEERLLAARFGEDFAAWRRRVRRWL